MKKHRLSTTEWILGLAAAGLLALVLVLSAPYILKEPQSHGVSEQYRQLMEERQKLQQAISEAPSGDDRAELNKKATAYNQKAEAYDNRLNDFNKKVARYNQQISDAQEKGTE